MTNKEIPKFETENSKPESTFSAELEKLGSRVDLMTAGDIEIENFELDPSSILDRWKKIFGPTIKNQHIEKSIRRMGR